MTEDSGGCDRSIETQPKTVDHTTGTQYNEACV